MWDIAAELYSGLGIGLIDVIILLTALGAILLAVAEMRIALMCAVLLFMGEFIIFYEMGYSDFYKPLICMLLSIVLLILSLIISSPRSSRMVV